MTETPRVDAEAHGVVDPFETRIVPCVGLAATEHGRSGDSTDKSPTASVVNEDGDQGLDALALSKWIALGTSAALGSAAIVAEVKRSEAEDAYVRAHTPADVDRLRNDTRQLRKWSYGFLTGAAVSLAVGLVLTAVDAATD